MLVYTPHLTSRFCYIAEYLLGNLCGYDITLTADPSEALAFEGPMLCYDGVRLTPSCLHIVPAGLLAEEGVRQQEIILCHWEGMPAFFQTHGGDLPFDVFSAAFYLVSRYEEYLPHEKDLFGRFPHELSLAFRERFLEQPLVERWAQLLSRRFPQLTLFPRPFVFVPSYDIDMAWSFLEKGLIRNVGGLARSLMGMDFAQAGKRLAVLAGKRKDPFDVYEWLDAVHLKYGLRPMYFFPVGASNTEYDKHILPHRKKLRELIHYHSLGYPVGIHPSWASSRAPKLLRAEINTLQDITGLSVTHNRFHFIAFNLPEGYLRLREQGITADHSMGYGSINGFRASTSIPFFWYDLAHEEQTELMVHPFCWMDANAYYEQGLSPAQAFAELKGYHDVLKKTGGVLSVILHNNFLSEEPGFGGWKSVYEIFLEEVVYWDV
jgi:hypothetical protein